MTKVQIYTDDSARGNSDDPGGYGTVLHFTDSSGQFHEKTVSGGYIRITNNRMELVAAIVGLEALNRPYQVELCLDSKYLTDASNQYWIDSQVAEGWGRRKSGPVRSINLWKHLLKIKGSHQVKFIWTEGHASRPENKRCDALATSAADSGNLMIN